MAFWNMCLERNTTSLQNSNNKIAEAIVKANDFLVIQTEVTCTNFIVENNLTILVADKAGNMFRKNVPRFRMHEDVWLSENKNNNFAKNDIWQMTRTLQ
jgi:hypothetical protein